MGRPCPDGRRLPAGRSACLGAPRAPGGVPGGPDGRPPAVPTLPGVPGDRDAPLHPVRGSRRPPGSLGRRSSAAARPAGALAPRGWPAREG
eukprot:3082719-Pyramimonas_sp.AAC.1